MDFAIGLLQVVLIGLACGGGASLAAFAVGWWFFRGTPYWPERPKRSRRIVRRPNLGKVDYRE